MGAGCTVPVAWKGNDAPVDHVASSTRPLSSDAFTWKQVDEGVELLDARVAASGVGARLLLWRFAPSSTLTWSLATSTEAKTVGRWADRFPRAKLVMNAGYFHEDGLPSGWVFASGDSWGTRQFSPEKSGIATLGERPALLSGRVNRKYITSDAFQSFPWIIEKGKRVFLQETGQYARRTFLAQDVQGAWYVGIVPEETVTLYQLGLMVQELPIEWDRVLNLDGGTSTGVVMRFREQETRVDSFAPIFYSIVAQ